MVELLLYLLKVFGLPIVGYFLIRQIYKRVSHLHLLKKITVPLNIIFILACGLVIFELAEFPEKMQIFGRLTGFLLYLVICYVVIKALETIFVEDILQAQRHINIPVFVRDIVRFFLLIVAVTILLKIVFDIEPSAFIVTSTVISAVIGLALQDMLANIISGIALQIEQPFNVGDWVRINDREGKIVEMSWRTTKLRTRENDFIITPNTMVSQQEIFNYYTPTKMHVIQLYVGTSYNDAPNKVKDAIVSVLKDTETVQVKPAPQIYVKNYNDFSIDYEIRFWIKDYEHVPEIQDQVMTKLWYQFRRDDIEIPFPIRNVNLAQVETKKREQAKAYRKLLDEIVESIHDIDILHPFSRLKLYEWAHMIHHSVYARGEHLVRQGEYESSFYIIKSGLVEVSVKAADGSVKIIGTFGEDYYFGEVGLLTGEARSASVVALEDTEALIIDKESFAVLLKENPKMAETLTVILQERNKALQEMRMQVVDRAESSIDKKAESKKLLARIQRFFNISS